MKATFHRRIAVALSLVILLSLIGLTGCRRETGPKNLLLITVDSLRPDRLGFGGNERPTSSVIDRIASESVRFPVAYSQAGWTLPSVSTILTGQYPSVHGAVRPGRGLNREIPTLASQLAEQGYDTHAFISHVLLTHKYGLHKGFNEFDATVLEVGNPHKVSTAIPLTDAVIESLETTSQPFFFWVHYFDPHFDYMAHADAPWFGGEQIDRYDNEIAHTDAQIGRLLDWVDARGLTDQTVVAFTADHGENFGERHGRFHFSVYQEVVRIPLLLRAPGLRPGTRRAPAEQIDLMPTLLNLLDVPVPAELPGRDLLAKDSDDQPIFVERVNPREFKQHSVILGRYKLSIVEKVISPKRSAGKGKPGWTRVQPGIFLFDLEEDPGELNNLYDESHPEAQRLMAHLEAYIATGAQLGTKVDVDPETREKLRALGYIR